MPTRGFTYIIYIIVVYSHTKPKKQEKLLPFVTEFNPAIQNIKQILSKNCMVFYRKPTVLKKDLPTKTNQIVQTKTLPQRHACYYINDVSEAV